MPDSIHWTTFFSATIVLLLIPGPSVMYVVTRGVEQGYRGVVFSSLGLALGDLIQVLCTVAGLSALLASSVALFDILKYLGAAYLIVLGLHRLLARAQRSPQNCVGTEQPREETARSLVVQALFALNPKTAIFFLALFPQFVSENAGPAWRQILLFGGAFVVLGFVTNSMYGCFGGSINSIFGRNNRFQAATRYLSGVAMIAMGVAAAMAGAPRKPL